MKTFGEISIEYKELLEINMSKANKSIQAKKIAKKKAIAKGKRKCSGSNTPSVKIVGTNVKVTCTPKDKARGMKMRKVARKMRSNPAMMRKKAMKTNATKAFRK